MRAGRSASGVLVPLVAVLLGLGVLVASQLPTIWAARADRLGHYPGRVFTGAPPTYADDASTYWTWMRQAAEGRFFFTDLYTPEEHPRNYVNLLFWTLGTVARATGLSVQTIYTASRWVLGALLIALLWVLACQLFECPGERLACYFALLLSGGWEGVACYMERNHGWSHLTSPGWWTPEMSTFFSLILFPHFLAGFVFMIATLLLMVRAWSTDDRPFANRAGFAASAGVLLFILTFFHPYDVVPIFGALWTAPVLFSLSERRWALREAAGSLIASAVMTPALVYNLVIFLTNPAMRWWDLQNMMITPPPGKLLLSLGVGAPLAALALLAFRRLPRPLLVMLAWLVATLVIIQLPLRFQRRAIGGLQIPLQATATAGIVYVLVPFGARWFGRTNRLRRATGDPPTETLGDDLIARRSPTGPARLESGGPRAQVATDSTGMVEPRPPSVWSETRSEVLRSTGDRASSFRFGWGALAVALLLAPFQIATPYYVRDIEWRGLRGVKYPSWILTEQKEAIDALGRVARPGSIVLSSYQLGNLIPPLSGVRCFIGHYALTIDAETKEEESIRFFSGAPDLDPWRLDLIRRWRVEYLIETPAERALGAFDPSTRPWLREVFSVGTKPETRSAVYEVLSDRIGGT